MASNKRVKPGDVFGWGTPRGRAHIQFIGRHPEYGDAVLVHADLGDYPKGMDFSGAYVTFYPVGAALRQGLVELIDHVPAAPLPTRFRRAGARSGTKVETWIIEDNGQEKLRRALSEAERQLPIAEIVNHELLTQRILQRWHPAKEGSVSLASDKRALQEVAAASDIGRPHVILHYLYLPAEQAASAVATELQRQGFEVEQRMGADGVNWLVLAQHLAEPTEERLASVRTAMESLVERFGGEYDGWEAEVREGGDMPPPTLHS